jgi:hypothetical protein
MAEAYKFPDEDEQTTQEETLAEDELEVEVVDDTPEQDKGRRPLDKEVTEPTDDELENYSEGVKKRIKELTHARHDERRAKEATLREKQELERMARALMEENRKLKQYVNTGEQQFAETAKSAAQSALDVAKRKYKEAYESGDADAVIAAQEELTEAKLRAEAAKNFRPTTLQVDEDTVQMPVSAPQQAQIDDKTLRWQAKNQWFGAQGYEEITAFSLGLHKKLVDSGVDPRSDEYFERIDSRLRSSFPEMFGGERAEKAVEAPKKPATVVAPATRSTSAKKIRLTATQLAIAKRFGLTPQQYAAEVAKLESSNG